MRDIFPPNFNNNSDGLFDESIKVISNCPVCHYQHNSLQARMLEETDGAHLVYIKCQRCQSSTLVLVMTNSFGISSVGLVTDLDSYEVSKFKDLAEVNDQDILEVYQYLQNETDQKLIKDLAAVS